MEQSTATPVRALAEAVFLVISFVTFLSAEFTAGMTCDDVCSTDPGDSWRSYAGSPQWDQIAFLGWAVLLLGAACAIAARRGHRGVAGAALGGWALCWLGLASLL